MKSLKLIFLALLYLMPSLVEAEVLLKTQTSWDSGKIHYPKGQAEITAFKFQIEEGHVLPFHCHPVPTLAYILKGRLEVETKAGKKVIFKVGDSIVEVMRTVHRGRAIEAPVEIIGFYAGSTTMPNTVLDEEPLSEKYCSP